MPVANMGCVYSLWCDVRWCMTAYCHALEPNFCLQQTPLLMFAQYSCRTCLHLLIDHCQAFWTRLLCVNAGPNAPLVLERGLTSCHMEHVYDFYKPAGLYPKVCHCTASGAVSSLRSMLSQTTFAWICGMQQCYICVNSMTAPYVPGLHVAPLQPEDWR